MWPLSFISEEDFSNHVKATIEKYGEKLESFDLKRFNRNLQGLQPALNPVIRSNRPRLSHYG